MRRWTLLAAAIVVEVAATLSLRAAQEHSAWLAVVVVGYLGSFVFLTLVLRAARVGEGGTASITLGAMAPD